MDENQKENQFPTEEFKDEAYHEAFGEGAELEEIFRGDLGDSLPAEEVAEKPVEASQTKSERKGRPARKKGYGLFGIPHILATVAWLAIVIWIGVSLGRVIWVCAADVLAFGRPDQEVVVTIEESDTLDDIADKLQDAGLIHYTGLFKFYGSLTDAREKISAGTFTLNTRYDYMAMVNYMRSGSAARETVTVTIPEGYSCAQIFALLEEKGVCKAEYLEECAARGELDDYWFLEGVERGDKYCLEGYLFPDTYEFYTNDEAENVLEKMLDDFDYRFSEDHIASIDTLNERLAQMMRDSGYGEDYIAEHKVTVREVVIVASLIEKETANTDESFTIASVIYNRLTNLAEYPFLNIDAALVYALGTTGPLTTEDLQTDTPYNTYIYKGLIPGPIANPGLNSLNAALNPEDTNYHYYVLDTNSDIREHHFSKTYEEHLKFIESLGG